MAETGKGKKLTMVRLRRAIKRQLHSTLDATLFDKTRAPNGEEITILDDLCVRATLGLAISVSVHVARPPTGDNVPAVEEQRIDTPAVRPLVHTEHCADPADCDGACLRGLELVP